MVAGDTVWAASAAGTLYAVAIDSGSIEWSMDFNAPILSGVVPAGEMLFVATYDGTLHALISDRPGAPGIGPEDPTFASAEGCGCKIATRSRTTESGTLIASAALFALLLRLRRRTARDRHR